MIIKSTKIVSEIRVSMAPLLQCHVIKWGQPTDWLFKKEEAGNSYRFVHLICNKCVTLCTDKMCAIPCCLLLQPNIFYVLVVRVVAHVHVHCLVEL